MNNEYKLFQDRLINLYVVHPELENVWKVLDSRRMFRRRSIGTESSPQHLFLIGKSRVGKSQAVKRYAKRERGEVYIDEENHEVDIVPVVYMELPDKFTPKEFYYNIIEGLGAPKLYSRAEVGQIKDRAFHLLKKQKTEMLIIDELDYLTPLTSTIKAQAMELIKGVANKAGVCLVCVGTPDIEALRTLNGQHIGRYPPKFINRFETCDEKFIQLLNSIDQQINSPVKLNLSNMKTGYPQILHLLSHGFIGWLVQILQNAFNIIGVMDEDFKDFNILKQLTGEVLIQARDNVLGELTDDDIKKILN